MDMELLNKLASIFGLNIEVTPVFIGMGVWLTAFLKDKIPKTVNGKAIDITVIVFMAAMNGFVYIPLQNWPGFILGTLLCYALATGGQAWLKNLAHKAATPK